MSSVAGKKSSRNIGNMNIFSLLGGYDAMDMTLVGHSSSRAEQLWHFIYWCYTHQSYFRLGIMFWEYIGEYCLKLVLSRMHPMQANLKKELFKSLGINVDEVRNGTIYEVFQALRLHHAANGTGKGTSAFYDNVDLLVHQLYDAEQGVQHILAKEFKKPIHSIEDTLKHVLERILHLKTFFCDNAKSLESAHHTLAAYFLSLQGNWTDKEKIIDYSKSTYGGSHWFEVGLSAIETKFEERKTLFSNHCSGISSPMPSQVEVAQWLQAEYEHWFQWSLSFGDILDKVKPEILHQIKSARDFIYAGISK